MTRLAKQSVVVYREGGEDRLYDTCYGPEDAKAAVRRCVSRKGTFADVRTLYAEDYSRKRKL